MNRFLILLCCIFQLIELGASNKLDSINTVLKFAMDNKELYVQEKENKIKILKEAFYANNISVEHKFEINKRLYHEYEKYKADSAIYYLKQNITLAQALSNRDLLCETQISLASLYSNTGQYIESRSILDQIKVNSLSSKLIPRYYEVYGYFCDHYAQSNGDTTYYKMSGEYRDSLLVYLDPNSIQYKIVYSEKIFYKNQSKDAEVILADLLNSMIDDVPDKAVVAYLLGVIYKHRGDLEMQKRYFSISAIVDLKNAIKDNASLQALSLVYYQEGNIDLAYKYIKSSLDDALFGNMRYRASESTAFYPIINAAYQAKETKQKEQLELYLIFISILSLFLIVTIVYIYKQMQRVARIRKELYRTNVKLQELNEDLKQTNAKLKDMNSLLSESNRVKEEYIAHFFDLCSAYISKMEDYRKQLNKKAINKQLDELYKALKSTTFVDSELEELYRQFDTIFLNLYPSFIEEFNELLIKEERITLKQGELLNTELRIFALIRLGITDSVKIASFLRYSLSTIYNYRTKARNKAAVSREDFEKNVMLIGNSVIKSE